MLSKTKFVIATALVALSATTALAASENDGGNETGGYVVPGSMDGVNPAYHPGWFPNYPRSTYPRSTSANEGGRGAYGYVTTKHHVVHKPARDAR